MSGGEYINDLLKRQARTLGLSNWHATTEDEVDEDTKREAEEEAKRLAGFAGLREAAPGGDDEPSALLSPIVEMCDSAEELMVLGLQGLKAELQRVGLKCGGTAQERAERLFRVRGKRLLSELDASLVAKAPPPSAEDEARKRARVVVDQQGPLLPGKKRKQIERRGPAPPA